VESDDFAGAALRRRAVDSPEEPFLFYRDERGHVAWWSWARAARELDEAAAGRLTPGVASDWLARLAGAGAPEVAAAQRLLERLGAGPERDVWLSWRPLEADAERTLALAAVAGGWAVLREPADPLPAATFAWARPTLIAAPGPELDRLADDFAALAPRLLGARWRRRRLARLRAVLVEGGGGEDARGARWRALGGRPRILSLAPDGW
jgi:hypothetical protein